MITFAIELVLALALGLVVTFVVSIGSGRKGPGPWSGFLCYFAVSFLAIWAGGIWIRPAPAGFAGVSWLSFLAVAVVVLLLLAALLPPPKAPSPKAQAAAETDDRPGTVESSVTPGIFFWALLIVLAGSIALNYAVAAIQEASPPEP